MNNKILYWMISSACNLSCRYCFSKHTYYSSDNKFVSINTVKNILDEISNNFSEVVLTGGEIFLNRNLFEIIKLLKLKKIEVRLITNALLLTKCNLKTISRLGVDSIVVSIDSVNPIVNDKFRSNTSTITKHIEDLANYEISQKIVIAVVSRANIYYLKDLFNFCLKHHFRLDLVPIDLTDFQKSHAIQRYKLQNCNTIEKEYLINFLKFWAKINNTRNDYLENFIKLIDSKKIDETTFCPMGTSRFVLTPDGDLYPCFKMINFIGNVYSDNVSEIINPENTPKLKNIQGHTQIAHCFSDQCLCFVNWDKPNEKK